ncbi:MAG: galactose oxidase [Cyclobacteriaceae bacterium]
MKATKTTLFVLAILFFQTSYAQSLKMPATPGSCTQRHENSLVAVGDEIVLVGGRGIKPTEIFDTRSLTWTKHVETPIEMHHFQAITYNGEVYVMGGLTGGFPHEKPIENIYIFNIAESEWRKGPEVPKDRLRGAAGCAVYNDKMYLAGGIQDGHWDGHVAWLDEYDPVTNTWRILADAPHARDHVSIGIINDKIYMAGGRRTSGITDQYLDLTEEAVDVYDFSEDTWETLPDSLNIPTQRAGCFAVVMGQKLLILGGESASQVPAHSEVEAFDTEKMEWESLPELVRGRHGTGATIIDGRIYTAAGCGQRGGSPELNSVEVFE